MFLRHLVGSTLLEQPGETEAVLEAANRARGLCTRSISLGCLLGQEDDQLVPESDMSPRVLPQASQSPRLCHSHHATSPSLSSLRLTLRHFFSSPSSSYLPPRSQMLGTVPLKSSFLSSPCSGSYGIATLEEITLTPQGHSVAHFYASSPRGLL